MKLAPIVLFVYNRPDHTRQVLEALSNNHLSADSVLYIYSDGPKNVTNEIETNLIAQVRELVRSKAWCKEIKIIESPSNLGLKQSIITGVTEILNEHGKVIVLEDDIVTSKGFLTYMNEALDFYESDEEVMHVSGYMFPVQSKLPETFFYNTASCWGWGTWKSAWERYIPDPNYWMAQFQKAEQVHHFNIEGAYDFYSHLVKNVEGQLNSWSIMWYCSIFFNQGFALHPYPSLVNNIGNDGSGVNSAVNSKFNWNRLADNIRVQGIEKVESVKARKAMGAFHKKRDRLRPLSLVKSLVQNTFSPHLIHRMKRLASSEQRTEDREISRLQKVPRFLQTTTNLLGNSLLVPDTASFLFMYAEIFKHGVYDFPATNPSPVIIDGGANIGLSTIYFKRLFPEADITAFEPDARLFPVLRENMDSFGLKVKLVNRALWDIETEVEFKSDGADAGRIESSTDLVNKVKTVQLSTYLKDSPVDFLKLDIEGAELRVLRESRDVLKNVKNLFLEYHSFTGEKQSLAEILEILQEAGFRYIIKSPALQSQNPLIKVHTYMGMDMQLNIYGRRD